MQIFWQIKMIFLDFIWNYWNNLNNWIFFEFLSFLTNIFSLLYDVLCKRHHS